jgi:hypothetical protein
MPLVILITAWFTIIFICLGLLAPRSPTIVVMFFLCALAVAGAVFMALELDRPFTGVTRISSDPIRRALDHLGK